jgi:hypothetical protein
MIVASPIAARMPIPAHAPGREPHAPEVQVALDRAAKTLTDLGPAANAFTAATREGHADGASFGRAAIATNQLLDDIHTVSIGRWPNPAERHAAAAEVVGAMAGQLTSFGSFWSLPYDASKPLVNVRTGAVRAAALAQDPATDFSGGVAGGTLSGIANGMRYIANRSFASIGSHPAEAGFLAAGVARTVDDAQQRLQDALNSVGSGGSFRAARQAHISATLLDAALTEGSSLVSPADAARVRTAVDGVLQLTDASGSGFPHGSAGFADAVRALKDATTPVLEQLDDALAPHLTGPDAGALREWRIAPSTAAVDGYYTDTDLGV